MGDPVLSRSSMSPVNAVVLTSIIHPADGMSFFNYLKNSFLTFVSLAIKCETFHTY
jgi:hypothetical protein